MAIQKPEWFKLDPAKFLSDALVDPMTTLELGACVRLLCRQWLDGFIPDDQPLLARLCRIDDAAMGEAWLALSPFFPVVEAGKRANRYMWIEREKVVADLEKRSDEGTKAAKKRWDDVRAQRDATANGSPMPEPMQDQTRPEQTRAEETLPQTSFADEPEPALKSANPTPTEGQVEKLYSFYPKKREKLAAKKAIRKSIAVVMAGDADHAAMPLEDALDYLAARVRLYGECVQGTDREFIPYPATWFNAGGFWDDAREWKAKKSSPANGSAALIAGSALDNHRELLESSPV